MGSPAIFKGAYAGLLSSKGVLTKDGQHILNDGVFNYITNNSAASNTSGWATYDDGASATPVDGTGGTASNFTIARDTTSKVRGTTSFALSNNGANAQGEGASFDFTLNPLDVSRLMRISVEIDASDANYSAADMGIYLVSDTGGTPTLITPSVTNIPAGKSVFEALVVTQDQTDVRLCFHTKTTSTSDYTIYVSNIKITPELTVSANPKHTWVEYSPTFGGDESVSARKVFYSRDGEDIFIRYYSAVSSGGTGIDISVPLPTGLTVNSDYYDPDDPNFGNARDVVGHTHWFDNGTSHKDASVFLSDASTIKFLENGVGTIQSNDLASGDNLGFVIGPIPIAEWAGSVTTVANSRVEYASTSGTWDADDTTTSFGPGGTAVGGALTVARLKTITWNENVQPTDNIEVQLSKDGVTWFPANGARIGPTNRLVNLSLQSGGSFTSGVTWYPGASANQTIVSFGQKQFMANDDSPSGDWESSDAYWRVVKSSNPQGIGTGLATATQAGAVARLNRWRINTLSASVTATTAGISDLAISDLVVGRQYKLTMNAYHRLTGTTLDTSKLDAVHDSSTILSSIFQNTESGGSDREMLTSSSVIFEATATSIAFNWTETGTCGLIADGTTAQTFVMIEELSNNIEETTDFT